jgi:uncharacterized membrane protein YdjX (TVP38/TMEM64 family)
LLLGAVILLAIVAVAALPQMHAAVLRAVAAGEATIRSHTGWGAVAFVVLSALSAMLAFVSSTVFVPVAIRAWGAVPTMALLWFGWLLGGAAAYGVGRFLGRRVVMTLIKPGRIRYYERRLAARVRFPLVLLFQAALPSEIPGYVLGILRYSPRHYLLALAIAELPYAVASGLLGSQFLERQYLAMAGLGLAGLVALAWAAVQLHRRLEQRA